MPPAQLILVHGTFAGLPTDSGSAWWQNGSEFSSWLVNEVGSGVEMPAQAFHWSGENSEHERREAGRALLRLLREHEREGRAYHLIGHSHGGSAIWHALQDAATDGGPELKGLRSWATVGTPYLVYTPNPPDVWRPATLVLTIALSGLLLDRAFVGWDLVRALPSPGGPDLAVVGFYTLCLALLLLLAWGVAGVLRAATFPWLVRRRHHRFQRAWAAFGRRHTGLWSREDEAIAGLTNTLGFGGPIIPRPRPGDGSFAARVWAVLRWPLRLLYHRMGAPVGDALVWEATARNVQGTDVDGERMSAVRMLPMADARPDPPLPVEADAEIVHRANAAAGATLARMRTALGASVLSRPDAPTFIREAASVLSADELVHTSYFTHAEVRRRLRDHVLANTGTTPPVIDSRQEPPQAALGSGAREAPHPARHGPVVLLRARAAAAAAVAVAVWTVALGLYDGAVLPYTDEHQVRSAFVVAPFAEYAADGDRVQPTVNDDWFRALAWLPAACSTRGRRARCPAEMSLSWNRILPSAGRGDSVVSVLHLAGRIEDPYQRVSALAAFAAEAARMARDAQRRVVLSGGAAGLPVVADWGPARRLADALAHSPASLRWGHESMVSAHAYQPVIEAMLRSASVAREPASAALHGRQAAAVEIGAAAVLIDSMASTLLLHLRQLPDTGAFSAVMTPDVEMLRARVDSARAAVGLPAIWPASVDEAVSRLRAIAQGHANRNADRQAETFEQLSRTVSHAAAAGNAAALAVALRTLRDTAGAYGAESRESSRRRGEDDWRDAGEYWTSRATVAFSQAVEVLAKRQPLDEARRRAQALGIGNDFDFHARLEPFIRVPADAFSSGEFLRLERRALALSDSGQQADALTLLAEHALRARRYEEARRTGEAAAALLVEQPTPETELNPLHPSEQARGARRVLPTLARAQAALGLDSAAIATALKVDAGGELEPSADERLLRLVAAEVVRGGRAAGFRAAIRRATRLRRERSQVYRILATVLAERGALRPACLLLLEERGLAPEDEVAASAAIIHAYGRARMRNT